MNDPSNQPSAVADNNGNLIPTASPSTPPSSTMDASAIANGTTNPGIQFPQNQPNPQNTAAGAMTQNASVPNTIPDAASITGQETQQTPAEQTNTGLLGRLAGLIGNKTSLATLQGQQETAAGVPGLTKTVNDLNTQLQGLNDQATALANQAGPGGAIENQEQLNATGRGITTGGQAPLTAADMRKNQIQQSALSSQALTLKSAVYAAQGNLTLAKDAADKAGQVAFDAEQQNIDYTNALIDQNKPQMTKEEQAQADTVKAQLADRQNQIDQAKQDYSTGTAMAAAAMKMNPDDPQAQYAAQQALKLDPKDPQYLQKVAQLVGKYQQDPNATAKAIADLQLTRQQIQSAKASEAYTKAQTAALNSPVGSPKQQDALEQQYRATLDKVVSARSGGLGLQDQKVDQATHLAALMNQFKDSNGNFNIPKSQYTELAMGLANLISPSGTVAEGTINSIQQATGQGDLGKAYTYITGQPANGTSQDIAKLMAESIDRQAGVASNLRDGYMKFLSDSAPTGLDPARKSQIDSAELNQYTPIIDQSQTSNAGNFLISPDGKQQVDKSKLTPAQLKEAATAGWK